MKNAQIFPALPIIPEYAKEMVDKALRHNQFIHKYVMALDHALLWVAALSLAAYFHVSKLYAP